MATRIIMQCVSSSDRIINALINSYYMDIKVNEVKKNKYRVFSPYRFKSNLFIYISLNIFGMFCWVLFPLFPIIKSLRSVGVIKRLSTSLLVISSVKSEMIYSQLGLLEKYTSTSLIGTGSTETAKLGISGYLKYLKRCCEFFKTFKFQFWFYPSLLQVPKMITFEQCLQEINPQEVIFTNHYDRWTSMIVDYCILNGKKSVLIQHGIEDDTSVFPKHMYRKLTKLICYNEIQSEYFRKKIFNEISEIEYFKPTIELVPVFDAFSILIVGHGDLLVVDEEIRVILHLAQNENIKIYVKPHPVLCNSVKYTFLNKNVHVIRDKKYYPDVDVLLHSGSTLAEEYSNCSAKVKILSLSDYSEIIK